MSFDSSGPADPLAFMRNLWGGMGFSIPGMVAPTFDVDELDKRIKDMKAVEGWLRMNLSMLQMTIQNLEMQRTTVAAVQTMTKMAGEAAQGLHQAAVGGETRNPTVDAAGTAFSEAAMWPWHLMQQMREQMEQAAAAVHTEAAAAAPAPSAGKSPARKK